MVDLIIRIGKETNASSTDLRYDYQETGRGFAERVVAFHAGTSPYTSAMDVLLSATVQCSCTSTKLRSYFIFILHTALF